MRVIHLTVVGRLGQIIFKKAANSAFVKNIRSRFVVIAPQCLNPRPCDESSTTATSRRTTHISTLSASLLPSIPSRTAITAVSTSESETLRPLEHLILQILDAVQTHDQAPDHGISVSITAHPHDILSCYVLPPF